MPDIDWQAEFEAAALEPQSVSGEAGSVTNKSIDEMLKAQAAAAAAQASTKPHHGIGITKLIPPGTT